MMPTEEPEVPWQVAHLWAVFWKVDRFRILRSDHKWGSIPPTEIEAWTRGVGMPLTGWEFEVLTDMDAARRLAITTPKQFEAPKVMSLQDLDDMLGF